LIGGRIADVQQQPPARDLHLIGCAVHGVRAICHEVSAAPLQTLVSGDAEASSQRRHLQASTSPKSNDQIPCGQSEVSGIPEQVRPGGGP
jgi:hypothetical protein